MVWNAECSARSAGKLLTSAGRSGTLTVAGTTTTNATSVTVNSQTAERYSDATFAKDGFSLSSGNNAFTATASDSLGRSSSHSITVNLPASPTYTYDSNGNMTSDSARGYEYDDENQLVRITQTNSWKSEFTYDGKMRRRVRKEFEWVNSAWVLAGEVRYVYDGNLVVQERDLNNVPGVTYTRGKDLSGSLEGAGGIGGLLARIDNAKLSIENSTSAAAFYHADSNGNITALTDAAQGIAAKYTYDPFGNILSKSGPLADANLYRFSSKEFHANSGLVYYLYRYYEPGLQRWVNRDPLGDKGSCILMRRNSALNSDFYRFVHNAPFSYIDPYGLAEWTWPANGSVCNCNDTDIQILIAGQYYTLPPGECSSDYNGHSDDVDGYWVNGRFYEVDAGENARSCEPDDDNLNACPKSRGAPSNLPPVHRNLPYVTPPIYNPGPPIIAWPLPPGL